MKSFAILAIFLTAVNGLAHPAPDARAEAAAWADAHPLNLPRSYDDYSTHSLVRRKAIYQKLDEGTKDSLWRSHVETYRTSHDLTEEQNDIIDNALAWLNTKDKVSKHDLYNSAVEHFGKSEAAAIFATLGPEEQHQKRDILNMKRAPSCQCSVDEDLCSGDLQCRSNCGGTCQVIKDDCGWFWADDCDGLCYDPGTSC